MLGHSIPTHACGVTDDLARDVGGNMYSQGFNVNRL